MTLYLFRNHPRSQLSETPSRILLEIARLIFFIFTTILHLKVSGGHLFLKVILSKGAPKTLPTFPIFSSLLGGISDKCMAVELP